MSAEQWRSLLLEPSPSVDATTPVVWFESMARQLLFGCELSAGGGRFRPVEIEFYYHSQQHPDPFSHQQSIQRTHGLWYFHRVGSTYRGGTFKGLDLTFGGVDAFGGILLRSLESEDGSLIEGPCLVVEHLLNRTQSNSVAELDRVIAERPIWDTTSPLHLQWTSPVRLAEWIKTARVGLSLRGRTASEVTLGYLLAAYRYLSRPRELRKGKLHMNLALHARGVNTREILACTKCSRVALARQIKEFEAGRSEMCLDAYSNRPLDAVALARLYGVWYGRLSPSIRHPVDDTEGNNGEAGGTGR